MKFMDIVMDVLGDIKYKDWKLLIIGEHSNYLQWTFETEEGTQFCRKWLIPDGMSKSEIVSTAFKAALAAEEHEAREAFRYKGKKIFGPHFDVDLLADIAGKKENLDIGTPFNGVEPKRPRVGLQNQLKASPTLADASN